MHRHKAERLRWCRARRRGTEYQADDKVGLFEDFRASAEVLIQYYTHTQLLKYKHPRCKYVITLVCI